MKVEKFEDLVKVEKTVKNKIGANTLFALEASILKSLAKEQKKDGCHVETQSNANYDD